MENTPADKHLLPGVVLAGGRSQRMGGGDKCLLSLGAVTMLDHVLARLRPQVGPIVLNANGPAERFSSFGVPVVADEVEGFAGPLAGILAGMVWAAHQGASHVVSVAADTPFFPATLVDQLRPALARAPIVQAATVDDERGRMRQPTFGIWSVSLRDRLRADLLAGQRKVRQWADQNGCAEVVFDSAAAPFFNVNTPDDLARAEQMAATQ
ncbi:MAG: molybdenum cofactor guanylyltransferase MobA [Thalassovita sp.]